MDPIPLEVVRERPGADPGAYTSGPLLMVRLAYLKALREERGDSARVVLWCPKGTKLKLPKGSAELGELLDKRNWFGMRPANGYVKLLYRAVFGSSSSSLPPEVLPATPPEEPPAPAKVDEHLSNLAKRMKISVVAEGSPLASYRSSALAPREVCRWVDGAGALALLEAARPGAALGVAWDDLMVDVDARVAAVLRVQRDPETMSGTAGEIMAGLADKACQVDGSLPVPDDMVLHATRMYVEFRARAECSVANSAGASPRFSESLRSFVRAYCAGEAAVFRDRLFPAGRAAARYVVPPPSSGGGGGGAAADPRVSTLLETGPMAAIAEFMENPEGYSEAGLKLSGGLPVPGADGDAGLSAAFFEMMWCRHELDVRLEVSPAAEFRVSRATQLHRRPLAGDPRLPLLYEEGKYILTQHARALSRLRSRPGGGGGRSSGGGKVTTEIADIEDAMEPSGRGSAPACFTALDARLQRDRHLKHMDRLRYTSMALDIGVPPSDVADRMSRVWDDGPERFASEHGHTVNRKDDGRKYRDRDGYDNFTPSCFTLALAGACPHAAAVVSGWPRAPAAREPPADDPAFRSAVYRAMSACDPDPDGQPGAQRDWHNSVSGYARRWRRRAGGRQGQQQKTSAAAAAAASESGDESGACAEEYRLLEELAFGREEGDDREGEGDPFEF